ncbi:MAG: hypothetical protein AAFW73_19870, partial [Bacteroidota bacterium]
EEVLAYQNDEVVYRFYDNYDVPLEEARDIFEETKKFLYLSGTYMGDHEIFTHEPLYIIDEMWHTFLLFTRDYHDFCHHYFGFYIHHYIMPRDAKRRAIREFEEEREKASAKVRPILTEYYTLIYEALGEETLVKWMRHYGTKYTKEYLNTIRRPLE